VGHPATGDGIEPKRVDSSRDLVTGKSFAREYKRLPREVDKLPLLLLQQAMLAFCFRSVRGDTQQWKTSDWTYHKERSICLF
jgi:hypothetical protein